MHPPPSWDYARRLKQGWSRANDEAYFQLVVDRGREMRVTAGSAVPTDRMKRLLDEMDGIIADLEARYAAI